MQRLLPILLLLVCFAFHSASGQTTPPTNIVIDGQGATPSITLQTNVSQSNKAGETQHRIFGPYNDPEGDPGALYIAAGQSPTGGRNDIQLYNSGCNGGCNVPRIVLNADQTISTGDLLWGLSQLSSDQGGSLELGGTNSVANTPGAIPYIDFHYGTGQVQDFNMRIINDGDQQLSIQTSGGKRFSFTGNGLSFPDGTVQRSAIVAGPQGPVVPQGPAGPAGPAGPPSHSVAACSATVHPVCNDGYIVPPISPASPCAVTSDTGSCQEASGFCAVCKP